jgi:cytoplasmic iron level regulating protein YaaA (DUF328/UPF0246 family)
VTGMQILIFPMHVKPYLHLKVYTGLDAYHLKDQDIDFAQQHLRMLSGLYGLLRPLDLMMPYRLEMGTKLKNTVVIIYMNFGAVLSPIKLTKI